MIEGAGIKILPDSELLDLLRQDDRKAFELVYERYAAKLYYSAYRLFHDRDVCEDLVQELFIDLWVKRNQLSILSLESYLKVAIRNRVIYYIRTKKATLDLDAVQHLTDKYAADSSLFQQDITRLLETNMATLPEKCRQIFTLSRKEHLSNKEIACQLNISIKTVENQMTIALRYLRSGLSDYLPALITLLVLQGLKH